MRSGTIKGCIDYTANDPNQIKKGDDYYINLLQSGIKKVNLEQMPSFALNTMQKNQDIEHVPIFQAKIPVEYRGLSVDKIIQGTS